MIISGNSLPPLEAHIPLPQWTLMIAISIAAMIPSEPSGLSSPSASSSPPPNSPNPPMRAQNDAGRMPIEASQQATKARTPDGVRAFAVGGFGFDALRALFAHIPPCTQDQAGQRDRQSQ